MVVMFLVFIFLLPHKQRKASCSCYSIILFVDLRLHLLHVHQRKHFVPFLPALFESIVAEQEKQHVALPIKNGGLEIENLTAKAGKDYEIL